MIRGRRVFLFLISIAVCAASASAGMIAQPEQAGQVCSQNSSSYNPSASISDDLFKVEFDLGQAQSLPVAEEDFQPENKAPECQPLTDGTNSLSLCLSALVGFGVFGSVKHIKNIHLGFVPDWYHDGGPSRIGHSSPIAPDCLCNIQSLCFIQPALIDNNSLFPQTYKIHQIFSLWRDSQFTPDSTASRGPPSCF